MRRNRSATSLVLTAAVLMAIALPTANSARVTEAADDARRPNVVLIVADDLGVNDLSCYGRKDQPTPHLDALAASGMRFTSGYCGLSICSASRAALMTGKSPARLHLTTFLPGRADAASQKLLHPTIEQKLPLAELTIAERLKAIGYATACIGKWHLGGQGFGPAEQGFDVVYAGKANTTPSTDEGGKGEFDLTAAAEKFIDEHHQRPFLLYVPHNNPHVPLAAQAERVEKHKNAFNPIYAAMIETLDESVGRIVARLSKHKLTERTLFIFTSDNGGLHILEFPHTPATHNTPFRAGKGYLYEGGLRVPLIMSWPGVIPAGRTADAPVVNCDFTPTLLDICGLPCPEGLDGQSVLNVLRGQPAAPRTLFWHFPHYTNQGSRPAGAVRQRDWKLIEHYEDGRRELFDLLRDPGETRDLAAEQPERTEQ
ncbi:MAG TPA: sulfatase, partial [Pirellulaceae bacterium]|nr:sulfatase [Pirellulaceae bacterium]